MATDTEQAGADDKMAAEQTDKMASSSTAIGTLDTTAKSVEPIKDTEPLTEPISSSVEQSQLEPTKAAEPMSSLREILPKPGVEQPDENIPLSVTTLDNPEEPAPVAMDATSDDSQPYPIKITRVESRPESIDADVVDLTDDSASVDSHATKPSYPTDENLGASEPTPFLMIQNVCSLAAGDEETKSSNQSDVATPKITDAKTVVDLASSDDDGDGPPTKKTRTESFPATTESETTGPTASSLTKNDVRSSFTTVMPQAQAGQQRVIARHDAQKLRLDLVILDGDEFHKETDEVAGVLKKINVTLANVVGAVTMYYCNYCSYHSANRNVFISHVVRHLFVCQTCPFQSFSRVKLLQHSQRHVKDEQLDFAVLGLTPMPLEIPKQLPPFSADVPLERCPYFERALKSYSKNEIIQHFGLGYRYFCHNCPYRTQDMTNMEEHVLVHLGVWECRVCGTTFPRACAAKIHLENMCNINEPLNQYNSKTGQNFCHLLRRCLRKSTSVEESHLIRRFVGSTPQTSKPKYSLEALRIAVQRVTILPHQYYDILRDYPYLAVFKDKHTYVYPGYNTDMNEPSPAADLEEDVRDDVEIFRCTNCNRKSAIPAYIIMHTMIEHHSMYVQVQRCSDKSFLTMDRSVVALIHPRVQFTPQLTDLIEPLPMNSHDSQPNTNCSFCLARMRIVLGPSGSISTQSTNTDGTIVSRPLKFVSSTYSTSTSTPTPTTAAPGQGSSQYSLSVPSSASSGGAFMHFKPSRPDAASVKIHRSSEMESKGDDDDNEGDDDVAIIDAPKPENEVGKMKDPDWTLTGKMKDPDWTHTVEDPEMAIESGRTRRSLRQRTQKDLAEVDTSPEPEDDADKTEQPDKRVQSNKTGRKAATKDSDIDVGSRAASSLLAENSPMPWDFMGVTNGGMKLQNHLTQLDDDMLACKYCAFRCQPRYVHDIMRPHLSGHLGKYVWGCKFCNFSALFIFAVIEHCQEKHNVHGRAKVLLLPLFPDGMNNLLYCNDCPDGHYLCKKVTVKQEGSGSGQQMEGKSEEVVAVEETKKETKKAPKTTRAYIPDRYKCRKCSMENADLYLMKLHMKEFHPNSNLIVRRKQAKLKDRPEAVYLCPSEICLVSSDTQQEMDAHRTELNHESESLGSRVIHALEGGDAEDDSSGEDMGTESEDDDVVDVAVSIEKVTRKKKKPRDPNTAFADAPVIYTGKSSEKLDPMKAFRYSRAREAYMKRSVEGFRCVYCDYFSLLSYYVTGHVQANHEHLVGVIRNEKLYKASQLSLIYFCSCYDCTFTTQNPLDMINHHEQNPEHLELGCLLHQLKTALFIGNMTSKFTHMDGDYIQLLTLRLPPDVLSVDTATPYLRCVHCSTTDGLTTTDITLMHAHMRVDHPRNLPFAFVVDGTDKDKPKLIMFCGKSGCTWYGYSAAAYEAHDRECSSKLVSLDAAHCFQAFWLRTTERYMDLLGVPELMSRDWFGTLYCPDANWWYCSLCGGMPITLAPLKHDVLSQIRLHFGHEHPSEVISVINPMKQVAKMAANIHDTGTVLKYICWEPSCGEIVDSLESIKKHQVRVHGRWIKCNLCTVVYDAHNETSRKKHYAKHYFQANFYRTLKIPCYPHKLMKKLEKGEADPKLVMLRGPTSGFTTQKTLDKDRDDKDSPVMLESGNGDDKGSTTSGATLDDDDDCILVQE